MKTIKTLDDAAAAAAAATATTGTRWVPTDSPWTSPRFNIVAIPAVGSPVSRAFNGDYYPAGDITAVSPSGAVVRTDDGTVFRRAKQTGRWLADGMWSMVAGHQSRMNPEF